MSQCMIVHPCCCRDLGKAVERWRARLAVSQDAGRDQPQEEGTAGEEADQQQQAAGPTEVEDLPAGGEYEFVAVGEQRQAGDCWAVHCMNKAEFH